MSVREHNHIAPNPVAAAILSLPYGERLSAERMACVPGFTPDHNGMAIITGVIMMPRSGREYLKNLYFRRIVQGHPHLGPQMWWEREV